MAKIISSSSNNIRNESPLFELRAIFIEQEEANKRKEEIQELVAQIIAFSHKRGRKKKDYDHEESIAA